MGTITMALYMICCSFDSNQALTLRCDAIGGSMAWESPNGRYIRVVTCFGSPVSVPLVVYRQCSGFWPMSSRLCKIER